MHTFPELRFVSAPCRALGHDSRVKIVLHIHKHGPTRLLNLADLLGIGQPSATEHVRRLVHAHILEGHRLGREVYFDMTDEVKRSKRFWRNLTKGLWD